MQRLTPNGSVAWALADNQLHDQYQCFLLYVWTDKGLLVNQELARLGYARPPSIPPNTTWQNVINQAAAEAQAARRGLWGACFSAPK